MDLYPYTQGGLNLRGGLNLATNVFIPYTVVCFKGGAWVNKYLAA